MEDIFQFLGFRIRVCGKAKLF